MTKKRPIGVTVLAILVAVAGIVALVHALQFLHILPFVLGPVAFFAFDLGGALLWGILAAIDVWVFQMLWRLKRWGWAFVLVIALLNLFAAVVSLIGSSTFSAMLPALVVNGLVLIYALLPGTRAAFEIEAP